MSSENRWSELDTLRYELKQAISTTEFLHGCLTEPHVEGVSGGYTYAYPEMTLARIARWRELTKDAPRCTAGLIQSKHPPGPCPVHSFVPFDAP